MSAFQQALANVQLQQSQTQEQSGSALSIRGQASGAPSSRGVGAALRAAGIGAKGDGGMEVEGGARPRRGAGASSRLRSAGPLDQTGRHRPGSTPYGKPPPNGSPNNASGSRGPSLAQRIGKKGTLNPRRNPEGTPPILKANIADQKEARAASHAKLQTKLHSEEMKNWLRSRYKGDGVMDMSNLVNDSWLQDSGILPPGHKDAPPTAGTVFWRLIDQVIQIPLKQPIYTLSLANNNLHDLFQLSRLPSCLRDLRALDLSNNPIRFLNSLDELLAQGEKKGKATAGIGGLKSLVELKLDNVAFRDKTLEKQGPEAYQHEILRRFPGLRVLDGVPISRVVFAVNRQPAIKRNEEQRLALANKPYVFPVDVQPGFFISEGVLSVVMPFCFKFFDLFDNDRSQLVPGYAPNATISVSANTLISRSWSQRQLQKTQGVPTNPAQFTGWTGGRNFLRNATTIESRQRTLKSPMNEKDLLDFWKGLPKTRHPMSDASKWLIDSWVLGGQDADTKLCAMIQGQFEELPSGNVRSFSRTFVLAAVPPGSPAAIAGWPAIIISDMVIVHPYFGTVAFDDQNRSLAQHGVTIKPPEPIQAVQPPAVTAATALLPDGQVPNRDALVAQMAQRTGMNAQWSAMCLEQNGWVFETAVRNFEEIRATIPAEAFQP